MKNVLSFVFCTVVLLFAAFGQTQEPIQSLVNAELAFAKLAAEKNTRDAFFANINDESFGIENDTIVKLKTQWRERKVDGSLLSWKPVYTDIASSGDFGYTTGPWEYHTIKTVDPTVFGEYVTVWKKQTDGQWKILADIGIKHGRNQSNATLNHPAVLLKKSGKVSSKNFTDELMSIEKEYARINDIPSLLKFVSNESRFLREGFPPTQNLEEIKSRLQNEGTNKIICKPLSISVAPSGDLGFAMGTVTALVKLANKTETKKGKYLRIWKKEDGKNWKIVLDLLSY